MGKTISYQIMLWRRAWADLRALVANHLPAAIISLVGSAAVMPVVARLPNVNFAQEATLQVLYGVLGPIILSIIALLYFRIRAGAFIYYEVTHRLSLLEQAMQPRLRIFLPPTNIVRVGVGNTVESISGFRQTVLSGETAYLSLHCRNSGRSMLKFCQARLVAAWTLNDSRLVNLGIVESISLPWSREGDGDLAANILEDETKRIYIAVIRRNGIMAVNRNVKLLPIEYHQIFSHPAQYYLKIQVSATDTPSQTIILGVNTKPTEGGLAPIISILDEAEWVTGQHHHVSARYLHQYAAHAAWMEDHRRLDNGALCHRALGLALKHPVSRDWKGYWQRAR